MNINQISSNTFKGLFIANDKCGGLDPRPAVSLRDEEIVDMFQKTDLLEKLNKKNTDVIIMNTSDNSVKKLFLLNSSYIGDSYIPINENGMLYKTTISAAKDNKESVIKKINKFIKKAEEYASVPLSNFDKPKESLFETPIGKKLFDILMCGDMQVLVEDTVVSTPEEIFPLDMILEYENFDPDEE